MIARRLDRWAWQRVIRRVVGIASPGVTGDAGEHDLTLNIARIYLADADGSIAAYQRHGDRGLLRHASDGAWIAANVLCALAESSTPEADRWQP